jgi:hypothetical protein
MEVMLPGKRIGNEKERRRAEYGKERRYEFWIRSRIYSIAFEGILSTALRV